MPFPCPGCGAQVEARPDRPALRCSSCGARLRSRVAETDGAFPAFDVEVVGRPEARCRVEVPWDDAQRHRLATWLAVASASTLALVLVLLALALFGP